MSRVAWHFRHNILFYFPTIVVNDHSIPRVPSLASAGIDERECLKCHAPGRIGSEGTRIQAARHSTAAAAEKHTAHTQQRGGGFTTRTRAILCVERSPEMITACSSAAGLTPERFSARSAAPVRGCRSDFKNAMCCYVAASLPVL